MKSAPLPHSQLIKSKAIELGFSACGISQAKLLENDAARLQDWLHEGYNGSMRYMRNYFEKRIDPSVLVEGSKSVVSVLMNYYTDQKQFDPEAPVISKYALGKDYHYVLKDRLQSLLMFIQSEISPCKGRIFVDSAPLLEKTMASNAGLGWIGKNTLLIHPQMGSFLFIGELVLDLELECDEPFGSNLCGSCTRCIDNCPTGAIIGPSRLDARRCISYLNIETKDEIPESFHKMLSNRLIGCDICQDICPWNKRAEPHSVVEFQPQKELLEMKVGEWAVLDKPTYKKLFKHSAVERAGYLRLKRTLGLLSPSK